MELLKTRSQLPKDWWKTVPNDRRAYNYRTRTQVVGIPVQTLLDGGAGVNSAAEEVVVGAINVATCKGIKPSDPTYPVVQLETWPEEEAVTGISGGAEVPIIGAVVLRVPMTELGKAQGPEVLYRCKIFKAGTSDWMGNIIGARALDCPERGGLGFYPTAGAPPS